MVSDAPRAEGYLRAVRKRLICPKPDRNRLEHTLKQAVTAFQEDNPDADAEAWRAALGSPEDLAEELLSTCEPSDLERELRKRRLRQRVLIAGLAVLAVAAVLYAAYVNKTQGGYTEITTTIYVTEPPPADSKDFTIIYSYEGENIDEENHITDANPGTVP